MKIVIIPHDEDYEDAVAVGPMVNTALSDAPDVEAQVSTMQPDAAQHRIRVRLCEPFRRGAAQLLAAHRPGVQHGPASGRRNVPMRGHRRAGMSQHPLHHLRVGPRRDGQRRRSLGSCFLTFRPRQMDDRSGQAGTPRPRSSGVVSVTGSGCAIPRSRHRRRADGQQQPFFGGSARPMPRETWEIGGATEA